ncbi:MAG TPA: terminase small subunit [Caulobacteraceae bacterium]
MPILQDSRHEAFAQARARGARLEDAYEDAGYTPGNAHASRLATTRAIAERIAEIKAARAEEETVNPASVIAALIRMAKAGEELKTAAAIKEARLTILEAWNVQLETERARVNDRFSPHMQNLTKFLP